MQCNHYRTPDFENIISFSYQESKKSEDINAQVWLGRYVRNMYVHWVIQKKILLHIVLSMSLTSYKKDDMSK